MALDINGYNATFKAFTDFATKSVEAGKDKSIARASADVATGALAGREIKAATTDSIRGFFKWFRSSDEKAANDATRKLFRDAIIDMFGGESKIPAAVKKAMIMADYDCGKPLTARRILAVKAAIDASGTTEARKLDVFQSADAEQIALGMGYKKSELPKLARAAHFYAQAAGVDELAAMREVGEPGSKANRLMQYGGRFLESAQNFADGLRLVDSFATWFQDVVDTMTPVHKQERETRDFSTANTLTKLNIDSSLLKADNLKGIEKFVFEELASNPAHDLSGNDPEKLFGFKDNAAMRFIGRGYGKSVLSTIANIPPAKRAAIYAAYDQFTKNATNAQEAREQVQSGAEHRTQIEAGNSAPFLARLLRNFDPLEAMQKKGTLTARNILNKFFPDIADKGNYDYKAINKYQADLAVLLYSEAEEGNPYADLNAGVLQTTMNNCGTTIEETAAALRAGKMPSIPKMLCTGSVELNTFDGTTQGGRSLVAADADRPANYSIKGGAQDILKGADSGFGFTFPDGTRLVTNGTHKENIPTVCDKIENLCGRVHPAQANSVMMMLSQSGLTNIRGGIPSLGVVCNEHSAIEFSLSKDEKTGDVTIKYSSPDGLPFRFSWTATVDVDGNVKTTPMVTEKALGNISAADAKKAVASAAKDLGVRLGNAELDAAANLYAQHAEGMFRKNADYLAHYIVKLPLSNVRSEGANAKSPLEKSAAKVAAFAPDIKTWENFDFGDGRLRPLEREVARHHNEYIAECLAAPSKFDRNDPSMFGTFMADAGRQTFVVNGQTFLHGIDNGGMTGAAQQTRVTDAVKAALPNDKARKAISVLMNQSGPGDFVQFANHLPVPDPNAPSGMLNMHELDGASKIVHRNMMNGMHNLPLSDAHMTFALDVSPDGNTAVVTISLDTDLLVGDVKNNHFGNALVQQRITVDLSAETPTVTDVRFSQELR